MAKKASDRRVVIPDDASLRDLWAATPARVVTAMASALGVAFATGLSVGELNLFTTASDRLTSVVVRSNSEDGERALAKTQDGSGNFRVSQSFYLNEMSEVDRQPSYWDRLSDHQSYLDRRSNLEGSTDNDIVQLRAQNEVELIHVLQHNLPIERIPPGRFGFAFDIEINYYIQDGYPFRLRLNNYDRYAYEVHKLRDHGIYLVGYVAPADAVLLNDPTRSRNQFGISSKQVSGTVPIAIRMDDIATISGRDLPDNMGNIAELTLKKKTD